MNKGISKYLLINMRLFILPDVRFVNNDEHWLSSHPLMQSSKLSHMYCRLMHCPDVVPQRAYTTCKLGGIIWEKFVSVRKILVIATYILCNPVPCSWGKLHPNNHHSCELHCRGSLCELRSHLLQWPRNLLLVQGRRCSCHRSSQCWGRCGS